MKGRLPLFVVIGSSVTFLVSLYLPWGATRMPLPFRGAIFHTDLGWGGDVFGAGTFSQLAALCALALVAIAIAATIKPRLESLPFGSTALAFGVFAVLSASQLWTYAVLQAKEFTGPSFPGTSVHLGVGAYLGLTAVGIACAATVALRWRELARPRSVVAATGQAVLLVLLVSFVLPALNGDAFPVGGPPIVFIILIACLAVATWSREGQPGLRLANAGAIATLVAGGYLVTRRSYYSAWPYELWMMVSCAFALLVLALAGARRLRIGKPSLPEAATAFAAVLVLVSLFLPWTSDSTRGWLTDGDMAGGLVLLLLVGMVARGRIYAELAIAAALYVMTAGLAITVSAAQGGTGLGYGAFLGFVGAGLLLPAGLSPFRPMPPKRFLFRSVPITACLVVPSFAVAANTYRLDSTFVIQSPWVWFLFLGAATIVLSLRLLVRWMDEAPASAEVVFLPLGLLALTALALVPTPQNTAISNTISWEGWDSVFLCVLLVACGWIERKRAYPAARTDGSASITSLATSP